MVIIVACWYNFLHTSVRTLNVCLSSTEWARLTLSCKTLHLHPQLCWLVLQTVNKVLSLKSDRIFEVRVICLLFAFVTFQPYRVLALESSSKILFFTRSPQTRSSRYLQMISPESHNPPWFTARPLSVNMRRSVSFSIPTWQFSVLIYSQLKLLMLSIRYYDSKAQTVFNSRSNHILV